MVKLYLFCGGLGVFLSIYTAASLIKLAITTDKGSWWEESLGCIMFVFIGAWTFKTAVYNFAKAFGLLP